MSVCYVRRHLSSSMNCYLGVRAAVVILNIFCASMELTSDLCSTSTKCLWRVFNVKKETLAN